jgi:hypothetical protein
MKMANNRDFIDKLLNSDDDTQWRAGKMLEESDKRAEADRMLRHNIWTALRGLSPLFVNLPFDAEEWVSHIGFTKQKTANIFKEIDTYIDKEEVTAEDVIKQIKHYLKMIRGDR